MQGRNRIKTGKRTGQENRVFAMTASWIMEEKQAAIHSSIWYINDIAHPSHAQTSSANSWLRT